MALPRINCPKLMAVPCNMAPIPHKTAPGAMILSRPCLSDNVPVTKDGMTAVSITMETAIPSTKEDSFPNESANWCMWTIPPIEPVSYPLRKPPKDRAMDAER